MAIVGQARGERRAVIEDVGGFAPVAFDRFEKGVILFPKSQDLLLQLWELHGGWCLLHNDDSKVVAHPQRNLVRRLWVSTAPTEHGAGGIVCAVALVALFLPQDQLPGPDRELYSSSPDLEEILDVSEI